MSERLRLESAVLREAGRCAVAAASVVNREEVRAPAQPLPSLPAAGDRTAEYLEGVRIARGALADAATTAARSIAACLDDSTALDAVIAARLGDGFAITEDA